MKIIVNFLMILVFFLNLIPVNSKQSADLLLSKIIYDDVLGTGWENWSWATVNLSASNPVHNGNHSISVTFGAWQGLYLHKSDVDTLGSTHLQFYIHGGGVGGQKINIYLNLEVGGSTQNGPSIAVPPPPANAWSEVNILLNDLNPTHAAVSGITWQSSSGVSQPSLYLDDIALVSPEDSNGPKLSEPFCTPRSVPADGLTTFIIRVRVTDPQGSNDISSVSVDGNPLGLGTVSLFDNGRSNDLLVNDGLFGAALSVPIGMASSEVRLLVSATDKSGHQSNLSLGVFTVLAPPGGAIPAALPQRLGYGSNAWSETPGQDWQVNSGVPWNYVYQYITWGWESWGGSFVSRFVQQAWDNNYIPVVTVYMMLGVPTNCGEGGECYAQKLQNSTTVKNYLDSLKLAAQEAQGSKPVIFHLEPDFYGSMQQFSNSPNRPPGVQPDVPASFPVALNKSGYPNNLEGFGRYLVDLIHTNAPNALVAPHASMWATNSDPQSVTFDEAIQMGSKTASFINSMGGAQADLLFVEWSDRDAGSGLRPWWDDSDHETPRPTRAIIWENALSKTANKRLFLWQVPVGNMSQNNTCDHYQDNRTAYIFNHPRDLFDTGIIGVLFGGGAECMTQVNTDGGFVVGQGAIAYALPTTPVDLVSGGVIGSVVHLRWKENPEPDLWGYQVDYHLKPGGPVTSVFPGRRNSIDLRLPTSGQWEISISSLDAMGNKSTPSSPVVVNINSNSEFLYLPSVFQK